MQIEIREIKARKALCMSHRGPYPMIPNTFIKLFAVLAENGVEAGPYVAIYYDDPEATPSDELRSDAGTFVPNDFVIDDPRVHIVQISGGTYAVGTHIGPHNQLSNAWREMGEWLASSGYAWDTGDTFEVYLDDGSKVPEAQLRTEVCIPVKAPA